jgi:hypothetical protein
VHFTARSIEERHRHTVSGMSVTGVERTIADVVRADGWSEQVELAVWQSLSRGMTTPGRLSEALPKTWQRRLQVAASIAGLSGLHGQADSGEGWWPGSSTKEHGVARRATAGGPASDG